MNTSTALPWVECQTDYTGQGYPKRARIKAKAGLHKIGEQTPYFSVTADIYVPGRHDIEAGGCLHDDVLRYWPVLAPVVALHLSNNDGVPMHAAGNGLYWLGFTQWVPFHAANVASHFRITEQEATELRDRIMSGSGYDPDAYATWIEAQRPRWKQEADDAITLILEMACGAA